jgi:hypothetical protein
LGQPVSKEGESIVADKDIPMPKDPQVDAQTSEAKARGEYDPAQQKQRTRHASKKAKDQGPSSSMQQQQQQQQAPSKPPRRLPSQATADKDTPPLERSRKEDDLPRAAGADDDVKGATTDKPDWERTRAAMQDEQGGMGMRGVVGRLRRTDGASSSSSSSSDTSSSDEEDNFNDGNKTMTPAQQLSQEDRRQLVARLRTWAADIHKRADFRQGVHALFDALTELRRRLMQAADVASSTLVTADPTTHRVQAQQEARRLLEQFAGGHSLEPTVQSLRQLVVSTKDDPAFERVRALALPALAV